LFSLALLTLDATQFNFLKPTHSLFSFFTSLCDAYSRVLMPPKGTKERLSKDAADM
jgi:splicing factor 3A subunit 1